MMGNKGGVSCRMNIHHTSLCFVCVHMAAGRGDVAARNSDFHVIMEKTLLLSDQSSGDALDASSSRPLLLQELDNDLSVLTIAQHGS